MWPMAKTGLSYIYMAKNNFNSLRPSEDLWLQILFIIGSGNDFSGRCQAIG